MSSTAEVSKQAHHQFFCAVKRRISISMNPERFVAMQYEAAMKRKMDIADPQTYTEEIQRIKLKDHNPLYTRCADKVQARAWAKGRIAAAGAGNILNYAGWYGVYSRPEAVDFDRLPDQFVLKSNHASGQILLCLNKSRFDRKAAVREMRQWMKVNYYYQFAEWQYKNIPPRIICEELLEADIIDYKLFCFQGNPQFVKVTKQKKADHAGIEAGTYDILWKPLDFKWKATDIQKSFDKPAQWSEMLEVAKILSAGFHFVRVDLYETRGRVYFGELTFTPNAGFEPELSIADDRKLGELFCAGQR